MAGRMVELAKEAANGSPRNVEAANAAAIRRMDVDDEETTPTGRRQSEPQPPTDQRRRIIRTPATANFIHPSLYEKDGIIIQFINHAGNDMGSIIGGVRIGLRDIALFPEYLMEHEGRLKAHAATQLLHHLKRSQSSLGLGENLVLDDFSISWMPASVTAEAACLNPNSRNEGGMWMCAFPHLLQKVDLGPCPDPDEDDEEDEAYLVNCYINLVNQNSRRRCVQAKQQQEAVQKQEAAAAAAKKAKDQEERAANPHLHPPPKKTTRTNSPAAANRVPYHKKLEQKVLELEKKVSQAEAKAASPPATYREPPPAKKDDIFPQPVAQSSTPMWVKEDLPELY